MGSRPATAPPKVVDRFFEFSLLGMLAAGYFALAGSGYLDFSSAVVMLAALSLRALMAAGIVSFQLPGRIVAVLVLLYIGFYPVDYFYLSTPTALATVHLLFFLAVVKILTAHTTRDYILVRMIAAFELIAAALLSVSLSFFAFLALFLFFWIATFLSGEIRRSSTSRRVLARAALAGLPRRLILHSGALFLTILIMTGGLFFVLPRTARAALDRFLPQRRHIPGFSTEINLGDIGAIKKSSAAVMHVRAFPADGLLAVRWRGAALTEFDGHRWFNPPIPDDMVRVNHGVVTLARRLIYWRPGRTLAYHVLLSDIAPDTLFFAGTPETLSIDVPYLHHTVGGAYRLGGLRSGPVGYSVYSYLEDESVATRSAPFQLPVAYRDELLRLPPLDERIRGLAREMTAGATTENEKARALEAALRHDYAYTLDLPSKAVGDPLANFLFVRRKGHCEYFASAMAVMLRTLGIPSRIVVGFQSGVFNPITGWQVVRASDAHSWVEGWIAGRGWTTFDPTPADPSAITSGVLARASLFVDAAEQFWQDWVLSYDLDRQVVLASRVGDSGRSMGLQSFKDAVIRATTAVTKSGRDVAITFFVTLSVLVGAFFGPALGRWWTARKRVERINRGEADPSDATLLYQRMLTLLERRGIQKPPWLTPGEFVRTLPPALARTDTAILVEDLTSAYYDFRFGGRRDAAPRMMRLLTNLEKAVLERVPAESAA